MPATSKAERRLMAIAEHHPDQVSAKNRGVLDMSQSQLHEFAATSEKRLPAHVTEHQRSANQTGGHPHRMGGSHDGLYVSEHHRK